LGFFVLAGVLTMMTVLGALIAALSVGIGRVLALVTPLADIIVVALGLLLLLGMNPFARLPQIRLKGQTEEPFLNAYIYGLLYGPIALPCSGPLVVSLFTLSFSLQGFFNQLLFFLIFGLGFGIPLLAISFLARSRQGWILQQFSRHYHIISRVGGLLLIFVGVWDLTVNFDAMRLYLGI
jgi:cytochrome c-type biogenesis protein